LIGKRLGHYEVIGALGAGGMGEVYRARDTRLDREVAIKVLPEDFAADAERLARFEREAKLLASLNHANIAGIYGFEEVDGVLFTAMELVEGETLEERMARPGGVELEEILQIAGQIATALEGAHESGVVHRDLKPANVKITPEGYVKVLDFGLAKALLDDGPAPETSPDLSQSPTMLQATGAGMILGTAAYMSPEQARGKPVDKRTDIWAFGVVLYEMLTGRRAFEGETVSDVIAAVLTAETDLAELPASTPAGVARLLGRCLERDPRQRLRDIGEARIALQQLDEPDALSASAVDPPRRRASASGWLWAVTAASLLIALVSLAWPDGRESVPERTMRFGLEAPAEGVLARVASPVLFSPDGDRLVYTIQDGLRLELRQRFVDTPGLSPIAGSEGGRDAFFSPDGEALAFFADGYLKRVPLAGGVPETVTPATNSRGGAWNPRATIVFTPTTDDPLFEVEVEGGEAEAISTLDLEQGERSHRWPDVLPGGDAVVFSIAYETGNPRDDAAVAVLDLATGRHEILVRNAVYPRYVAGGHLLYIQDGDLYAAPFDLSDRSLVGPARVVQEGVDTSRNNGASRYSVSQHGDLVYVGSRSDDQRVPLVWVDRDGNEVPLAAEHRDYANISLVPETNVAFVEIGDPSAAIWTYDLSRDALSPVTIGGVAYGPIASADGSRIAFETVRGPLAGILTVAADGTDERRVTRTQRAHVPTSWGVDGTILYTNFGDRLEVWAVEHDDETSARPLVVGEHNFGGAVFSPDQRWIAYVSDESGRLEVYLRPYPSLDARYPVSTSGGRAPRWSRNGDELFYISEDGLMSVAIATDPTVEIGRPQLLFRRSFPMSESGLVYSLMAGYDVDVDARRFLMARQTPEPEVLQTPRLVLGFTNELLSSDAGAERR